MKHFGYTVSAWEEEPISIRGELMAHMIFDGMLEGFATEMSRDKSENNSAGEVGGDSIQKRFGGNRWGIGQSVQAAPETGS